MFEIGFQPLALQVSAPSEDELRAGAPSELMLHITGGVFVPVDSNPSSTQAYPIPAATFRFPLNKDAAKEAGQRLIEEAEKLPDKPNITLATDLSQVQQAADFESRLRGGR